MHSPPSSPLLRWQGERSLRIAAVAEGHKGVGDLVGRTGRPLDVSKPLAHAYVIVMLSEFQGFARDLHDLAVDKTIALSGASASFTSILVEGLVSARAIDRGNATHQTIKNDFARIGLTPLDIAVHNPWWARRDARAFDDLIALRNVLGHGNTQGLQRLLAHGRCRDTVSWARGRIPVLNRYATALDRLVWDHLRSLGGEDPWS